MVFLHFFGFGDSLRLFELEQETGLLLKGFRPIQLDALLQWTQWMAVQQHWDADRLQGHVMALWMEKAEQITSWQAGLQRLPREQLLVVGLGSHGDWQRHWERLLRV
ncbi:MAG: hypothetical protein EBZ29_00120 [Synechococcaceae bacterium WB9_4xC_028]|jgi:hypothetical protein|uniref:hypothetical protein n=1 Tax=unclassified Synechococcus TaxID=2626047 RepID=UPI00103E2E6E|nr:MULTISPECIES: hypothetical protein [unclassified Synechococcus]NDD45309.1 hypothetical protein [Synechococcaceae bacterium WB9_4xB_025]NDD67833.1 hypothetical protein [Synechococcaceae bacterium WB9_4xC_028]QNG27647.1 hypothetical protein H0O21_03340 [Synechococcus sp. HK01-R]TCD57978.1 hypothetical protein CWE16_01275 [Synechococcus sp. BS55D]TCD59050.1 hypothetical protein CWE17_04125 [Synechococcus sp. BS56D]